MPELLQRFSYTHWSCALVARTLPAKKHR